MPVGRRAVIYNDAANFAAILREEMSGEYIEGVHRKKPGDLLVMGKP